MSGDQMLDDDDFDVEDEVIELDVEAKEVPRVADIDTRRRLEDQLEERRLRKMIQDYDFDLD
ncbi:MAG: hypothetical protein QNK31_10640 [Porticoccus sp.]|nr:hypothetical protein [Porticoccus sp.]